MCYEKAFLVIIKNPHPRCNVLFSLAITLLVDISTYQDFPEVAGVIAGMDDPSDAPWRLEVSHYGIECHVHVVHRVIIA